MISADQGQSQVQREAADTDHWEKLQPTQTDSHQYSQLTTTKQQCYPPDALLSSLHTVAHNHCINSIR